MYPMSVIDAVLGHLLVVALLSLSALGFRSLVRTSPLGKIPFKPFNCDTCLLGWGSIASIAIFDIALLVPRWDWMFVLYFLASTGVGKVLLMALGHQQLDDSPPPPEFPPIEIRVD